MRSLADDFSAEELRIAQYLATQQFYWEKKDVGAYLLLAGTVLKLLMHYAETQADKRAEYLEIAVRTSYNMASLTWSGWDEDGVTLDDEQKHLGLEAAQLNVRLSDELDLPNERKQTAAWMLGAQLIANGRTGEARDAFQTQRGLMEADAQTMADAWIAACDVLEGGEDSALETALGELGTSDEGTRQVGFLRTAMTVFTAKTL